jgi:C1A family cysteine protease
LTEEEFKSLKTGLLIPTSFDDQDDQESVRRSSSQVHQDNSHLRRSKRNLHRKGSKERRFFSDWFWDIFNKDDNDDIKLPDEFDWRTKGVVSGIKNQEGCGSCYAFATTAVMESLYAIKTQSENVTNFSPQQIVDCSSNGNSGCHGGLFEPSVKYLSGQGGKIATEDSYPYVGREETCKTAGVNQINLGNIESGSISKGNEKKLAKALVKYGPIFIGLNYNSDLRFYKSGILNVANCPNRRRDMGHALTLVGYGYDNALQKPYWIIKNSWGATDWGENGYLRLAKDAGNMCGVATMASYAKLT